MYGEPDPYRMDPTTLAQRARDRRAAEFADTMARGEVPHIGGPAIDPMWDAFFENLYENGTDAEANGLKYRVNMSSIGNPAGLVAGMKAAVR